MKKNLVSLLSATAAVVLAMISAAPVMAQGQMDKPAATTTASVTRTATVVKVDQKDRWVTLKLADGTLVDIQAGPEVKNFAQIKKGDLVTAKHEEMMAVAVVPGGQASPNVSGGSSVVSAPLGDKPMGVMVNTATISGKVDAIDYAKRSLTLVGPKGKSHTIEVGPDVQKFDAIKKGDDVVMTLKTATVIEVTTPTKKGTQPKSGY